MVARLAASSAEEEFPAPAPPLWHMDRKIPLAILLALLVQTCSIVWWAAKTDSRVEALESQSAAIALLPERMARVEEKLIALKDAVQRLERK